MARVEWSRLGGEQCEGVLGVLLLRRHERARRVRPSQGDRGVDVYVPADDGWTVFQVKSFTGPLTASQKAQITKSWHAFQGLVDERRLTVKQWVVIRPENPTWQDQAFLDELTAGTSWPCEWQGLDHCDELAASYPDVIDYYLRDGKERLSEALRQHLMAAGFGRRTGDDPVSPVASTETLRAVHDAINAIDPHYRYDFAVASRPAGIASNDNSSWPKLPTTTPEGLIATAIQYEGDRAIIFHVFARFEQATEERPVPLQFRIDAEPGTAAYAAWKDFLDYGIASPELLPVAGLSFDLPGELGVEETNGLIRIGPAATAGAPTTWTLTIFDDTEREVIAEVDLDGGPPNFGMTGRGWSLELRDPRESIDLLLRVDTEGDHATYRLRHLPVFGKPPRALLPGIRAAAAFHAPNCIQIAPAGGPPLSEPLQLNGSPNPAFDQLIRTLEDLATIQRHTFTRIVVPEVTYVVAEAAEWTMASRLLSGERIEAPWAGISVRSDGTRPVTVGDTFAILTKEPFTVSVGGVPIDLGIVVHHCAAVHVDAIDPADDGGMIVRISPRDNTPFTVYIDSPPT